MTSDNAHLSSPTTHTAKITRFTEENSDQLRERSENSRSSRQQQLPRGSYTQIVVNPVQLEDKAFTAWMQRLTEARRNRENRIQRPYRNYRKPYNDRQDHSKESGQGRFDKYQIKQRFKPITEVEVQPIMDAYRCTYEDVEELVDLFNLDFEECNQA